MGRIQESLNRILATSATVSAGIRAGKMYKQGKEAEVDQRKAQAEMTERKMEEQTKAISEIKMPTAKEIAEATAEQQLMEEIARNKKIVHRVPGNEDTGGPMWQELWERNEEDPTLATPAERELFNKLEAKSEEAYQNLYTLTGNDYWGGQWRGFVKARYEREATIQQEQKERQETINAQKESMEWRKDFLKGVYIKGGKM